nr:MAG TPA: hypothetical protein [Caudoviricetes sp.]
MTIATNSQFSGGAPCFLYIICNNITLISVNHKIPVLPCFRL